MLPYYYAMDTQFFMFSQVGKGSGLVQTRARFGKTGPPSWKGAGVGKAVHICDPAVSHAVRAARAVLDRLMWAITVTRAVVRHFGSVRGLLKMSLSRGSDAAFREGRGLMRMNSRLESDGQRTSTVRRTRWIFMRCSV